MLVSITIGLILALVTIAIHTLGTALLISTLRRRSLDFSNRWGELTAYAITAIGILLTHIVETAMWGIVYTLVIGDEVFASFEEAVYFSTVTFTTLGYGDIVLEGRWKMLSACQAMTGLLVFGWSTALLFAVVQRVWKQRGDDPNAF